MPCRFLQNRYSPLALPLGELSPQVTERGKASFLNDKINLFALSDLAALGHLSQRERQGMSAEQPAVSHCENATKERGHFPAQHIQAERHVRSAVCLLPTIAMQKNCRSYFIIKSKRQNARGEQKNTTKTAESVASMYVAFFVQF